MPAPTSDNHPRPIETDWGRRAFLARAGVLGLAAAAPPALFAAPARAATTDDALEALLAWLRPQLQRLSADTFGGVAAFCYPGPDAFSLRQLEVRREAGGIATRTPQFLMDTLDGYIPLPDSIVIPLLTDGTRQLGALPRPLPYVVTRAGLRRAQRLDEALTIVLENDEHLPASIVVALLLNVTAAVLVPASLLRLGFNSPFARLRYAEKARVFADLESDEPTVVKVLRPIVGDFLADELRGLVHYLAMALLALPSDGMYSEQSAYDRATKRLVRRPIGWDQTNYLPGRTTPPDGHAELLGYYQGRTEVEG
ncbi:hypothetical protein KV097_16200 [Mumia sp. zg.B17]|uniref:hypothetical protein n=1 Tax=Mumia sp. zg.B17 TaxID=2855446 RepID=UPI001C6F480F|nr:hypothetical protein [Mumia sp. zg.B17]MBW9207483.1 hypothetical protein [Mumia sp. zg.B17]